ncbi:helix-turn-helix domain-containing protein [Novosphingobium humi]|uniref:Helix-turn-helix domain-containing protein n=1 Tax=Novosphingobium humi TaxID=2282397 RepID=A0ABY7TUX1_9SPHN|nr:helix-turn-helix domain-containing protein [Novosphingobium humi]WCT76725.1 helix-turn-helix domain-containing protein [Novosphingobium humi]
MAKPHQIRRYALYGEGNHAIAPEFLHIETISARSSQHEWTISPHAHPGIFQLLLLDGGHGDLVDDTGITRLDPVSLVVVPSGCVHAFRFATDAQGWVLSLADALLHDRRLAGLLGDGGLGGHGARHRLLPPPSARRLGWLMADLAQGVADGAQMLPASLVAQLALVLALAAEGLSAAPNPPRSGHDALVARFKALVEAHYTQGWGVQDYAAHLATTAPTLTRACRAVLDQAPAEVVQQRLLLEAMRLLTYTASSIGQIASTLGFADPAYFARFFKARTGRTASDFRESRAWVSA